VYLLNISIYIYGSLYYSACQISDLAAGINEHNKGLLKRKFMYVCVWLQVLIKERSKVSGIKKNSAAITKFFEELAKIGE